MCLKKNQNAPRPSEHPPVRLFRKNLRWMLQNIPPKYSARSLRPYRLCDFVILIRGPSLYGADDTPKQDACYCEFYRAVNFVVRDTVTIPCLTVVRNTVAIRLGAQEACSGLQLLVPSKKCSLFKEKGLSLLLLLSILYTFVHSPLFNRAPFFYRNRTPHLYDFFLLRFIKWLLRAYRYRQLRP